MDSANGGLKLELSNAKLKTISDSQFMLWDEANKRWNTAICHQSIKLTR